MEQRLVQDGHWATSQEKTVNLYRYMRTKINRNKSKLCLLNPRGGPRDHRGQICFVHLGEQRHHSQPLYLHPFRPKVPLRLERPAIMPTNPEGHPFYVTVDRGVYSRTPRGQCAALDFELGENLFIGHCNPVERTVQINPFFVHDDGDNIVILLSPSLLNVI